jgi:hypothetical protein
VVRIALAPDPAAAHDVRIALASAHVVRISVASERVVRIWPASGSLDRQAFTLADRQSPNRQVERSRSDLAVFGLAGRRLERRAVRGTRQPL